MLFHSQVPGMEMESMPGQASSTMEVPVLVPSRLNEFWVLAHSLNWTQQ